MSWPSFPHDRLRAINTPVRTPPADFQHGDRAADPAGVPIFLKRGHKRIVGYGKGIEVFDQFPVRISDYFVQNAKGNAGYRFQANPPFEPSDQFGESNFSFTANDCIDKREPRKGKLVYGRNVRAAKNDLNQRVNA